MNEEKENVYDKLKPDIFRKISRELKRSNTILDVGCGDCQLVNFLAKDTYNKIVGIDISDGGFKKASGEAIKLKINHLVEYKKMDACYLDEFKDNTFDAIVMVYTLHEFDKPILVLKQVHRVLKNKGEVLIVDFPKGSKAEKFWGEKYFSLRQIKSMLNRTEFNELNINYPYGNELLLFASAKK